MKYEKLPSGLIVPRATRRRFLQGLGAAIIVPKKARADQFLVNPFVFAAAATNSYQFRGDDGADTATHTWSSVPIGTPASNRVVVVATYHNAASITGVTIDGTSMTSTVITGNIMMTHLLWASNTTAQFIVTGSASAPAGATMAVYAIYPATVAAQDTASVATGTGTSAALTAMTVSPGSVVIGAVRHSAIETHTWVWSGTDTGVKDNDAVSADSASISFSSWHLFGCTQSSTTLSLTASWSSSVSRAAVCASWL